MLRGHGRTQKCLLCSLRERSTECYGCWKGSSQLKLVVCLLWRADSWSLPLDGVPSSWAVQWCMSRNSLMPGHTENCKFWLGVISHLLIVLPQGQEVKSRTANRSSQRGPLWDWEVENRGSELTFAFHKETQGLDCFFSQLTPRWVCLWTLYASSALSFQSPHSGPRPPCPARCPHSSFTVPPPS